MDDAPAARTDLPPSARTGLAIFAVLVGLVMLLAMFDFEHNHIIGVGGGSHNICGPVVPRN